MVWLIENRYLICAALYSKSTKLYIIAFPTLVKYTSKPHPQPLSLVRRGEIKHSFIGVRLIRTSLGPETLYTHPRQRQFSLSHYPQVNGDLTFHFLNNN